MDDAADAAPRHRPGPHRRATEGFTTLFLDGKQRVVGATVVGPRAGETLGELTLAVRKGLTAGDLTGSTHAYPTYDDGAWKAAIAANRSRWAAGRPGPSWARRSGCAAGGSTVSGRATRPASRSPRSRRPPSRWRRRRRGPRTSRPARSR
ncbi:hypothetical protein [Blastococcus sp. SYSU DS0541]